MWIPRPQLRSIVAATVPISGRDPADTLCGVDVPIVPTFPLKNVCAWALGPPGPLGHLTRTTHTAPSAMACLQTMIQNVRDDFEGQLRLILEEIARDHQLDQKQLIGRYILRGQKDLSPVTLQTYPVPEGLPAVPREPRAPGEKKKGGRKPKFSSPPKLDGDLTEEFLKGLTIPLLKDACRMRKVPITGSKDTLIGRLLEYQANPGAIPEPRRGGRKKKVQVPEPVHNHPLDQETHPNCEQCGTYGNPMDPQMQNETFAVTTDPTPAAAPGPAAEAQEFEMDDSDIDAQLKAIVSGMNAVTMDDEGRVYESESDPETEHDPFGVIDYGEELEEEE